MAFTLQYFTSSQKEKVKRNGVNTDLTVDRQNYGIGGSWWLNPANASKNFIVSPSLLFGNKKDALDVEQTSAVAIKVSGLMNIGNGLNLELGVDANSLEDSTLKSNPYLGVGYLF